MKRIVFLLIGAAALASVEAQQAPPGAAPAPQPPKPGVPAVQHPMARIVPDAEYAITGSPDWLAMGEDQVWTNSRSMDIVSRMDPNTNDTVAVVPVKNPCSGLVVAAGTLWAPSCTEGVVYRIDTKTNMVVAKVPVSPAHNEGGIAYGAGSVWLPSDPKGMVTRIDPATNGVAAAIAVAPGSFTAVFGYGRVWVSSTEKHLVSVIHPATNKVIAEIPVDTAPRFMAVGEGYVWTLNQGRGSVTKIDPVSMKVVATIEVGVPGGGGDIAAGEGAVWVTAREIPVTRIDAATDTVTHQFVGPGGDAIRVLHGSVWLSNGRWSNVWRFQASKIVNTEPLSAFIEPGVLPHKWTSSGPKCMEVPGVAGARVQPELLHPPAVGLHPLRKALSLSDLREGQGAARGHRRRPDRYRAGRDGSDREMGEAQQQDRARPADRHPLALAWRSHRGRRRLQEPAERAVRGRHACPSCRRPSASRRGRPTSCRSISAAGSSI